MVLREGRTTEVEVEKLGKTPLLLYAMVGRETLGRPFSYELDLLSDTAKIDFSEVLGEPIHIRLQLNDLAFREFNGIVTHFSLVGGLGRYARYRANVRPWFWLLSQGRNSRVFKGRTVPQVVAEIFGEHGGDFLDSTHENYRSWEYLVQYNESDFNFVSRILEQEGIYYFFKHTEKHHKLVLCDSPASHDAIKGYEVVPYFPPEFRERRERDHIDAWTVSREIRPSTYRSRDFNFLAPANVMDVLEQAKNSPFKSLSVFDYPGEFSVPDEGREVAQTRVEEFESEMDVVHGQGNARGLSSGAVFKLENFPRDDQNLEYLLVETSYRMRVSGFESGKDASEPPDFALSFRAIPRTRQFRPQRITRKPRVEGPQTAFVVARKNETEEISTDEHARVHIRFHWDHLNAKAGEPSCTVRVAQLWAGSGFGGIHIPRVGQEVIVDFLEGDPDRPIITGRVYNALNEPPYTLPANATQSGIKSRSSKDGTPGNFNEIRFDDKKGHEDLFLHAERSQTTVVKGSQSISVGGERSITVTHADNETFKDKREVRVNSTDLLITSEKHSGYYNNTRETFIGTLDYNWVDGTKKTEVEGDYKITATDEVLIIQEDNMIDLLGALLEIKIVGNTSVSVTGGSSSNVELTAPGAKVNATLVEITGPSGVKLNS
jgi:type VI secretion system secreted protein VgrG